MATRTLIFFDTTEFSEDSMLSSPGWDSLADAAQGNLVEMAVSDVTVVELSRQVREKAEKTVATFTAGRVTLGAHGLQVDPVDPIIVASFESDVRSRFSGRRVAVRPLPTTSHAELLKRDIGAQKPFNRAGKGYRDALIWFTFIDCLGTDASARTTAYFVSANTGDFAEGKSGHLADELKSDLPKGVNVSLVTMQEIVATVRDLKNASAKTHPNTAQLDDGIETDEDWSALTASSAEESAQRWGLMTFRGIVGEDGEKYMDPGLFRLGQVENVTVSWVEVDESSVETTLVDTVSGTTIWEVRASARVQIEGLVHRGEASVLDRAWEARVVDFDDVYVQATHSLQCTLVADVRVEADEETTDGELTDVRFSSALEFEH